MVFIMVPLFVLLTKILCFIMGVCFVEILVKLNTDLFNVPNHDLSRRRNTNWFLEKISRQHSLENSLENAVASI